MPFNVGPLELIIILVIALLILGPGKLPEVGASLGKSIREFRKAATDVQEATQVDVSPLPSTPAAPSAPVAAPQPAVAAPSAPVAAPPAEPVPNVLSDQAVPNEITSDTNA